MTEDVHAEILSVAPIHPPDRLAAIGRTLDAFPEFVPTRMGADDPPRTPVTTVEAMLVDWGMTIHPGDYFTQFLERSREPPRASGLLWVTGDIWNYPPIGPHRLELSVDGGWFGEPARTDRLERFADLFRREVEAMDAFWAGAGLTSLRRQTNEFVLRAQLAGTLVIPGMPGTGWDLREHAVPDVFWLNYFGPACLERWGSATDELGVHRERTANGGMLVWATWTPFTFDSDARRLADYAWKRQFYDTLGWETVVHEDWHDPGRGVRVPSYDDHRRFIALG